MPWINEHRASIEPDRVAVPSLSPGGFGDPGRHAQGHPARSRTGLSRTGLSRHASPSFWAAWWAPRLVVRVLERIQTPREFRSPTGGEPAVELHEECLPVLLELRSAVLQGPRFCPHFVRWEADHQSSGNPALAILIKWSGPDIIGQDRLCSQSATPTGANGSRHWTLCHGTGEFQPLSKNQKFRPAQANSNPSPTQFFCSIPRTAFSLSCRYAVIMASTSSCSIS